MEAALRNAHCRLAETLTGACCSFSCVLCSDMSVTESLLLPHYGRDDEKGCDDDGHTRTGTVWTATTHTITAVIGAGVLALPWSVAQMGWVTGPLAILVCAYVTYYTATLLSDCYRTPDASNGKRNHTYMDAVRTYLGSRDVFVCGLAQYANIWGTMIGYTVTASMSSMAIEKSNCSHYKGHGAGCQSSSGNKYTMLFGLAEIVLSQFPNLEKITLISVTAAVMSFTYSFIGLFLCIMKLASNHFSISGSLWGVEVGVNGISAPTKAWHSFQALGNIAFAFSYAVILIEIQDTLKSPPAENKTMKKASLYGMATTTLFYFFLGSVGYAAFGNDAPGNVLLGFIEPFWVVEVANLAVIIHLIGAYQVYAQPLFVKYEDWLGSKWPESSFFHRVYRPTLPFTRSNFFEFTACKLILRTAFVILSTVIAAILPFFNAIFGLIGAITFWPLTVYFPVTIYMVQAKIRRGQGKWLVLQGLSVAAFLISVAAAVGSVAEIAQKLKK